MSIVDRSLLAVLALSPWVHAQGILYDLQPQAPHRASRATPRLMLERHEVRGTLTETLATYRVVQRFRNPAPHAIEGEYLCPIPRGATARGIALIVDGKRMAGEILDAAKAGSIYHDIVRRMKDPALLEYVDSGLLRASVFPVPANGTVDVEIDLAAPVDDLGSGLLEISLPLRHAIDAGAAIRVDLEVATTRPLETIYSPSHAAKIERKGANAAHVLIEGIRSGGDFRLYFAADSEPGALRALAHRSGNGDGYLMLLHEPVADGGESSAPRDVVFVVDRSGSMQGEKWEQAVKALRFGIGTLRDHDRFAFLSFASEVRCETTALRGASKEAKDQAIRHLETLAPGGGTNIAEALATALPLIESSPDRLPLVVFVTDGLPTIGDVDVDRILASTQAKNVPRARIFAFGVGYDVNTLLLDRLAVESRADSNYVAPAQDLEVPLTAFFAKVSEPRLTAPRLTVTGEGLEFYAMEPHVLPDLFIGDTLRAVLRYRGRGVAHVILEGKRGTSAVRIERDIELPTDCSKNEFLASQWATRRIGHLLEEIRLHDANPELVAEVTALGKEHGIVTPYTSGLVVEDDAVAQDGLRVGGGGGGANRDASGGFLTGSGKLSRQLDDSAKPRGGTGPSTPGGPPPSGEAAVRVSNSEKKMKRGELDSATPAAPSTVTHKMLGSRTFVRNGTAWIDSAATAELRTTAVVLVAFSEEYFAFVRDHKDLADIFALGDEVVFVLDGKAYHVRPG